MQGFVFHGFLLFSIVVTQSSWRITGNHVTPWAHGKKSVPCYYWKIIQLDGETKLAYMIRITETELIDKKPIWLRLERGRLFVNDEAIKPKSNQLQIVFAENDGKPHLIVADEKMAKTLPKLKGAAFPKSSELSKATEQICRDVDQFWSTLKSAVEHRTPDGKANK